MKPILKVTLINGIVLDINDFIERIKIDLSDDFPELDEDFILEQLQIIYYGRKKDLSAEGLRIKEYIDVAFSV